MLIVLDNYIAIITWHSHANNILYYIIMQINLENILSDKYGILL